MSTPLVCGGDCLYRSLLIHTQGAMNFIIARAFWVFYRSGVLSWGVPFAIQILFLRYQPPPRCRQLCNGHCRRCYPPSGLTRHRAHLKSYQTQFVCMHLNMCVKVCVKIYVKLRVNMCVHMYVKMCAQMCIKMCVKMFVKIRVESLS